MKKLHPVIVFLFLSVVSALTAMTVPGDTFFSPQLSPDGTCCLWESLQKSGSVWLSKSDGSDVEFLTVGHSPSWESDDTFNFVRSEDDGHVVLSKDLYAYDLTKRTVSLLEAGSDNPHYKTVKMDNINLIQSGLPLSGKVIAVDPGHGINSGAFSRHSKKFEDYYTLQSAFVVKDYLESSGATVKLTRFDNSICPALSARVNFSNSVGARAFVSIHYNSAGNEKAHGLEVYNRSYNSTSKGYAKKIHDEMVKVSSMYSRGVKGDKEVLGFYLGVLSSKHKTNYKSLTEGGFLSNKSDAALIDNLEWNEALSWGIYSGLCDALKVEANPRVNPELTSFNDDFAEGTAGGWLGAAVGNVSTDTPGEDNHTVLLKSSAKRFSVLRTGNSCWHDYTVSSTMRMTAAVNTTFGICAYSTLADSDRLTGYYLVVDGTANKAFVYKSTGKWKDRLVVASLELDDSFDCSQWHTLSVTCQGTGVKASVDGVLLNSGSSGLVPEASRAVMAPAYGKAGLFLDKSADGAVLEIDSFTVKSLSGN